MAFGITWDESVPAGSANASDIDTFIQNVKTALRERLQFGGMYFPSTHDELAGEHSNVRMAEQASNPASVANKGFLFTKDVAGITELFYMDSAGTALQITTNGVLNSPADSVQAKTGDWMISSVTTARTGWTNVSATYSNKFMRINATPLSTGGADTVTLTTTELPAHTHTGPAHTHSVGFNTTVSTGTVCPGGGNAVNDSANFQTGSSGTGATGSAGSGSAFSIVPAFVQVVVFQKD